MLTKKRIKKSQQWKRENHSYLESRFLYSCVFGGASDRLSWLLHNISASELRRLILLRQREEVWK